MLCRAPKPPKIPGAAWTTGWNTLEDGRVLGLMNVVFYARRHCLCAERGPPLSTYRSNVDNENLTYKIMQSVGHQSVAKRQDHSSST
ncbi:hypothetical protein Nepgr_033324 [Nepenthes gracilis]|uniref:Uncharacterized protein n=1 Tax=Nepenthes gracilis TaxID=150966 RepID=A0AAD3TLS1_NEPGR|nr:hypothetical protein Nepgr_033324 [Nepenthes gracilis]